MPMRARALDVESGFWRHQRLAPQRSPDHVNDGGRQVRQIAQRLMLDLATFTIGAAQQVSLIDFAFIRPLCRGYMNGTRSRWHMCNTTDSSIYVNDCLQHLVATYLSSKRSYLFDAFGLFLESQGELRLNDKNWVTVS